MQNQQMYRDRVEAELSRIRHDLEKLREKTQDAGQRDQTRFTRYVEAIEKKNEEISRRLDDLTTQGGKAKQDIEKGLKEAWDRVAIAAKAAKARFH